MIELALASWTLTAAIASATTEKALWETQPSLSALADKVTLSQTLPATDPQHKDINNGGTAANLSTLDLNISLWGPPHRLTLSVGKTDVWDRRRYQEPVMTLKTLKNLFLSDRAPTERFPNYYQSNHAYDSPCPKPVGQIIVGCDAFEGLDEATAVTQTSNGVTWVELEYGDRRGHITWVPMMTRNLIAVRGVFENVDSLVWLRLYRHQDTIEFGKAYAAYGTPEQRVRHGYNYGKDTNNGPIEPPSSGHDGQVFWIEQRLPAEKTFPDGFRYVMVGMVVGADSDIHTVEGERDLGTKPYLNESQKKRMIVDKFGHQNQLPAYDRIRQATGSAATATLQLVPGASTEMTWLIAIVTSNDAADPLEEAKRRLREATEIGVNGLIDENASHFRRFYQRREAGRIFTEDGQAAWDRVMEVFRSWTDKDGRVTTADPTRYEGGTNTYLEQDWAPWHGVPCYNGLYCTSAQVHNRSDRMSYYYKLVPLWLPAARSNAQEVFGLPGALIQHGYLPPVKPDTYAHTHSTWEFCMEIPAQVLKLLWDRFDYGGDETLLAETAYPAMRELAIFYSHYAELGEDGYYHVIPTMSAEYWNWTAQFEKNRDSASALSMFRWLLSTTAEASEILNRDADQRARWRGIATRMAPYPTYETPEGPIFTDVRDANPIGENYNFFAGFTLTTLADEINLDSSPEEKEMMLRTARMVNGWNKKSVLELLGESKGLNPEQLLNSRSGRIHLFPAVPDDAVVAFHEFQARGGFLISAQYDQGQISHVWVEARRDVTCEIMNPWPGKSVLVVERASQAPVQYKLDTKNGECVVFDAKAGREYILLKEKTDSLNRIYTGIVIP